jgi:GntR family transcriptional regulator/MocR family aminotransferase
MYLELDGEGALYHQLARAMKQAIVSGRILPGSRLPSTRELARELRISRNTVKAAYASLYLDRLACASPSSAYIARSAEGGEIHHEDTLHCGHQCAAPRPCCRVSRHMRLNIGNEVMHE